jgi:hypothetical protein
MDQLEQYLTGLMSRASTNIPHFVFYQKKEHVITTGKDKTKSSLKLLEPKFAGMNGNQI